MLGHRRLFEQPRLPHLGHPLAWVLEARASKQTWRASTLQMGIQPENRVRKDVGEPVFPVTGPSFVVQEHFYSFDCTQRSMDNTKLCSVSSPDTYRDQAFSLHNQLYTQVLGDLHHLLAKRLINILWPFSDNGLSTRKCICLNSVLPKVWCHSQKVLNKLTFLHSKGTTI